MFILNLIICVVANLATSRKRPIRQAPSPAKLPFPYKYCTEITSSSSKQQKLISDTEECESDRMNINEVELQRRKRKSKLTKLDQAENLKPMLTKSIVPVQLSDIPDTTAMTECWSRHRRGVRDLAWESAVGILNDRCLTETEARYDTYAIDAR